MNFKHYLNNPKDFLIGALVKLGGPLNDKLYLKMLYYLRMGKRLNLNKPQLFTEKIQWLKLYNRKPGYSLMVDKYEVKNIVSQMIGKAHIIPTLGVWEKPDDIEWGKLPYQFVLKTTHGGGNCGVIICKDKNKIDKEKVCKQLNMSFKQNLYKALREWPYKNVKKRIIAEQYMVDESGYELKDYKVFCFNGEPKMIDVDYNRSLNHQRNLYTPEWERINATLGYPSDETKEISKPKALNEILNFARLLSKGIPHVRVDFYIINDTVYFGELTFFHGSGFEKTHPKSFDKKMGDWLVLPEKQK